MLSKMLMLGLVATVAMAHPAHTDRRDTFDCYGKDDGNYPSHGACSSAYVTCDAGHRTHRHCPEGRRYHSVLDKCLEPVKTPGCAAFSSEENMCHGRESGFYGVADDCSSFIFCANEIMTRMTCGDGLHYNMLHHQCEDPATFPGECGTRKAAPIFDCHHREAGKYPHHDDCQAYYECDYDSGVWAFRCEHGFAFDGENCAPIGTVDTCLPARKDGAEETCSQGDGVHADPNACGHATMCWAGHGWDLRCEGETPYWSEFIQSCGKVKNDSCARDNAVHLERREGDKHSYYH